MRKDAVGFFWDDTPPPPPPKAEKLKRTPPEPIWLRPDYLPGLQEALAFPVHVMTLSELSNACLNKEELIVDVECYPNYFLAMFTSRKTGHVYYVEEIMGRSTLNREMLEWILRNFLTTGFNSLGYDLTMCYLAVAGLNTMQLKQYSDKIILEDARGSDLLRAAKAKKFDVNHIDLIEVAPLRASLKTYSGRLHAHKMQDLPFHPNTVLSFEQITITRWYCVNDTANTDSLRECLDEHVKLRYELSSEYGVDLRSKSDAQIAEAVIGSELTKRMGKRPQRPVILPGTQYRYKVPSYLKYKSQLMQWVLGVVANAKFVVEETGSVGMPQEIADLKIDINGTIYRMGIGGLHSSEKTTAHHTDSEYILIDKDVTSYYPYIILNLGLTPLHLGPAFLQVFRTIVERRVAAKNRGEKVIADSLKIVVNGSFGKLGSKWSILYSPDLLFQTTLTGQLSLLLFIEMLEMEGIHVVSANTDGIVIKCKRTMMDKLDRITKDWETITGFNTEETRYMALYSRDVNNYIAVKQKEVKNVDGSISWIEEVAGTKNKGAYANPWASKKNPAERLHKNPTATICVEAVEAYLTKRTPIESTVRAANDISKFVAVRSVKGGAVKVWDREPPPEHANEEELVRAAGFYEIAKNAWILPGESDRNARYLYSAYKMAVDALSGPGKTEYVGKAVRWYYGSGVKGEMVYAANGNKVPKSDGAVPLMVMPEAFPPDVDHEWYETEAYRILKDIGAIAA